MTNFKSMKINLYSFLVILFFQFGFSQNYELVDNKVHHYPEFKDIKTLTIRVKNDFNSDLERVRAIYTWMANTINYDLEAIYKPQVTTFRFNNEKEYKQKKRTHNLNKIKKAWQTKKATCMDYSLLFKELCTLLQIESVVIKGVTKVNPKDINNYRNTKDHAWNAVKIDGKWHLIDVTWSTGYEDQTLKWVKSFNDFFFLTKPNYFLSSHYPEHKTWQLVDRKISLEDFFSKPVFYASYYKRKVSLSNNQAGEIKVNHDRISITFNDISTNSKLYYMFSEDTHLKYLRLKETKFGTYQTSIKYKQKANTILTVYMDDQAILDFKINASK